MGKQNYILLNIHLIVKPLISVSGRGWKPRWVLCYREATMQANSVGHTEACQAWKSLCLLSLGRSFWWKPLWHTLGSKHHSTQSCSKSILHLHDPIEKMHHRDSHPGKGLVWVTLKPQLEDELSPVISPYLYFKKTFRWKNKICRRVSQFWGSNLGTALCILWHRIAWPL